MWTPWRYLNQNKHVQDNISLCRKPGKRKTVTWRVARLKPISGIFVELTGCLLTQNELISPRRALSAQSVHDIRLATRREMGWWRDRPEQQAGRLTHRLLPLQPGLSPLLPVAHYLNQTLDFRQESVLLAWKKCHEGHWNWKSLPCSQVKNQLYSWVCKGVRARACNCVYVHTYVCVWVAIETVAHGCLPVKCDLWNSFDLQREHCFGSAEHATCGFLPFDMAFED